MTALGLAVAVYQLRNQVDELQRVAGRPADTRGAQASGSGFRDLSFAQGRDQAGREGRPVMVFFRANDSGPSTQMETTTWGSSEVQAWLRENTVALRIDADQHPDLAVASGVDRLPVTVFFRADGGEIGRVVGYQLPDAFIREADAVLLRGRR
jgi:thiol:disulfide interchange protein DsbD